MWGCPMPPCHKLEETLNLAQKILFAADLFTFTRVVARANFLVRFENVTHRSEHLQLKGYYMIMLPISKVSLSVKLVFGDSSSGSF